ncbi:cytochrome P450 family protein [Oceanimonas sp. GK1]|uniref:cytochrome P450 n=1 Tax=Oceanimonas sp. (strain GK1 / IBRC-M 10197) TaxID=511062 RepID=UPI0002495081|nr:cytochrome P450 [Oceanimonas sp. GK1]AEY02687.1 cytochrome P450 family protein [Oceanimonas sp. GK1]
MTCPVFPKPAKSKASLWKVFFTKRHSWLDALYERSYGMKMGEYKLPGLTLYMVNQPDLVRQVMVQSMADFPKHRMLGDILEPLLGESIFTTNGEQWQKQRDMLDPAFKHARVQQVFGLMQSAANDMLERLKTHRPGQDIDPEMTFVTADIIFRTIMSTRLNEEQANRILDAFVRFQAESPKLALMKMFRLPGFLQRGGSERRRMAAAKEIRGTIEDIIRPRYQQAEAARAGCPRSKAELENQQDILSSLLLTTDASTGQPFGFDEIVDQISMLFLAGHETTASSLTWSLYLLATHPQIQEDAYQEVTQVLNGQPISVEALRKMVLVRDVFREALRLYPPVGFFARECAHATEMRNKHMKAGSTVMVSPWLIHRHKDYWHNPHQFDPYRFTAKQLKTPLSKSYLPFGAGPRVCIGAAFAQQESSLILASILQHYQLSLAEGFEPKPVGRLTIRSDNGLQLVLTPREQQP